MNAAPASDPATRSSFWRGPGAWLREKNLSGGYWIFFNAAFFYDTGFAVYWFLFNLYLLDFHFNDRAIGLINGALTLGLLAGTLPAGAIGRRFGPRQVLIFCFTVAPLLNAARVLWIWEPAQIALAFLAGVSMCSWTVSFLPAVSKLTTKANRTAAISLIFCVGVGSSALGGVLCGYLPQWLAGAGLSTEPSVTKRLILIASCVFAAIGLVPVLRLRMPGAAADPPSAPQPRNRRWLRSFQLNPFLTRFLVCMALWSAVLATFNPFANVYLSRDLHVSLAHIGLIFSVAQLLQLFSGLLVPVVLRSLGVLNGILATQLAAAMMLIAMVGARYQPLAIAFYLAFSASQWMSSPGLYSLLMNETPEAERSTASASTMFANSLISSAATAAAGIFFTRFGYPRVLLAIAAAAAGTALLCRLLLTEKREREAAGPAPHLLPTLTHLD